MLEVHDSSFHTLATHERYANGALELAPIEAWGEGDQSLVLLDPFRGGVVIENPHRDLEFPVANLNVVVLGLGKPAEARTLDVLVGIGILWGRLVADEDLDLKPKGLDDSHGHCVVGAQRYAGNGLMTGRRKGCEVVFRDLGRTTEGRIVEGGQWRSRQRDLLADPRCSLTLLC